MPLKVPFCVNYHTLKKLLVHQILSLLIIMLILANKNNFMGFINIFVFEKV
jgi:hypothetical protein